MLSAFQKSLEQKVQPMNHGQISVIITTIMQKILFGQICVRINFETEDARSCNKTITQKVLSS